MTLVREPDAGNPPVRFDEREVETEHGMRLLRHSRGNPETEYVEAYPTAPPLDSTLFSTRKKGDRHRGGNVPAYAITGYATEPVPIFRESCAVVLMPEEKCRTHPRLAPVNSRGAKLFAE
jgi:hypothetical protein